MTKTLAFDDVVVDFEGRRLIRGGIEQTLEPKAFAVLVLLIGSPGRVFTRDEILDSVWGHQHVTQSVLNRIMSMLRQALGEDAQHPRVLRTVHGVGYRFDLPDTQTPAPGSIESEEKAEPEPVSRSRSGVAIAATVGGVLLILVLAWLIRGDSNAKIARESAAIQPSLAVLPFADLSAAHDQEYLADGLAEEILNQVAQVPAIRVVGRSSSFSFRGRNEDLRVIGQKLGVTHLLEGNVRKAADRLRVTAQLIRTDDGTHLWSKTYTGELRDVFALEDEISRDVARALSVTLDVTAFNREQGGTTNVEAYERFLRWRGTLMQELYDFEHRRERLQLAREMVALDSHCILCLDALAQSLNSMALAVEDAQAEKLRTEAADVRTRIAQAAPESWIAKRDRANVLWRENKRAEAIALAKEIADSGPQTKERVWDYAYMIYAVGHLNDTIALVEQVRAVEPTAIFLSRDLQFDYTAARRFADAEAEYQRGLKLQGSQAEPHFVAFFRQLAGKRPGGLSELRALHGELMKNGFTSPFLRQLGDVLGDRAAMLALARKSLEAPAHGMGGESEYVMFVADALGDTDLAATAMRKTLQSTDGFEDRALAQYPYVLLWNAPYSKARAHPDFKRLLIETGVADYWRQTGKWGDGCRPVGADDFQCE